MASWEDLPIIKKTAKDPSKNGSWEDLPIIKTSPHRQVVQKSAQIETDPIEEPKADLSDWTRSMATNPLPTVLAGAQELYQNDPNSPLTSVANTVIHGGRQGLSAGLGDRIQAGLDTGKTALLNLPQAMTADQLADVYRSLRDQNKSEDSRAEQENPKLYDASKLAGTMALPLPKIGKLAELGRLGKYAESAGQGLGLGTLLGAGGTDLSDPVQASRDIQKSGLEGMGLGLAGRAVGEAGEQSGKIGRKILGKEYDDQLPGFMSKTKNGLKQLIENASPDHGMAGISPDEMRAGTSYEDPELHDWKSPDHGAANSFMPYRPKGSGPPSKVPFDPQESKKVMDLLQEGIDSGKMPSKPEQERFLKDILAKRADKSTTLMSKEPWKLMLGDLLHGKPMESIGDLGIPVVRDSARLGSAAAPSIEQMIRRAQVLERSGSL